MRRAGEFKVWIGGRGDVRDLAGVYASGIRAIVDLAMEERPLEVGREMVYCRYPLRDGSGNEESQLRAAIGGTAALVRARIPTLVACRAGMSRSPSVAAAAISLVSGLGEEEVLEEIARGGGTDVTGGTWRSVCEAADQMRILDRIGRESP